LKENGRKREDEAKVEVGRAKSMQMGQESQPLCMTGKYLQMARAGRNIMSRGKGEKCSDRYRDSCFFK
jgi:hypothetical protein